MNNEIFRNISRVIERDSKVSTYKFALLRGTIDVIQDNSPFIKLKENRAYIPTGLLIEKWILYYFPLLASKIPIPQNFGTAQLAFENQLNAIIRYYNQSNGLSIFYNDLRRDRLPEAIQSSFRELLMVLKSTITNMPMRYIGNSVYGEHYSIYRKESTGSVYPKGPLDLSDIINNSGEFSIPLEYYEAFKLIGSFVGGQDSVLFKWAEFSVSANKGLDFNIALDRILQSPVTERDVSDSKQVYKRLMKAQGTVKCVWTGRNIDNYDIDHIIPFAVWRNNDLWNLLPSSSKVNNNKRDKIPSPEMIDKSAERILSYWAILQNELPFRFSKEIQLGLTGGKFSTNWQSKAIDQLKNTCAYLIDSRGFESWVM